MHLLKGILQVVLQAIRSFFRDSVMKLCASLSYYTLFSLPPFLLLLVKITGFFAGKDVMDMELSNDLTELFGGPAAKAIQTVIEQMNIFNSSSWITIISTITLLLGASGVFSEIQSSLHQIWVPLYTLERNWKSTLTNRLFALLMIVLCSALVLVSLLLNTLLNYAHQYIVILLKESTFYIIALFNSAIIILVTFILFVLIYRVLPTIRLKWKYIFTASLSASCLFMLGKYLIGIYLTRLKIISIYGAAGTIIVVLVWVYYMSALLYFGAEIAKAYYQYDKQKELEVPQ